jgi:two-component system sensor histidine kinase QseC
VARYADGSIMLRDAMAPELPLTAAGFVDMALDGKTWRVYRLTDAQTGMTVQVGERQAFRDELVRYITRDTLIPLLVALPVLALLIWIVVGRALLPLQRLAQGVSRREPNSLEPIDEQDAPREIHGLVQALNRLFGRMRAALERERQFTSDAAHELRTPLAALKTHLQVAQSDVTGSRGRRSIDQALKGVDRAAHMVEQLLLLARADSGQERAQIATPVDLDALASDGVAALSQAAVERHIDLGIEIVKPYKVPGDRAALEVMLRNLIDNAIRYTPPWGCVTVAVGAEDAGGWLRVSDNGPGIPVADRKRVFDRFYRGEGEQAAGTTGTGLGLSIVQRIAQMHDARVELAPGPDGRGLAVTVSFQSTVEQ